MGDFFERIRNWLLPDDEYYDDYDDDMIDPDSSTIASMNNPKRSNSKFNEPKVLNIHKNSNMDIMNFTMIKYEVTGDICTYIKARKPVVVNMEKLDTPSAQRALDYLTGATDALDGSVEKVAENIFIFSPEHISVSTISEELKQKNNFVLQ